MSGQQDRARSPILLGHRPDDENPNRPKRLWDNTRAPPLNVIARDPEAPNGTEGRLGLT